MLTEFTKGLPAARKIDGNSRKASWPHKNLTKVDGRSTGRTENSRKVAEGLLAAMNVEGS